MSARWLRLRPCRSRMSAARSCWAVSVLTGMMPQAQVTNMCVCVGPPDAIAMGSTTVLVGGLLAARMGDPTVHGGAIVLGLPTVIIGG